MTLTIEDSGRDIEVAAGCVISVELVAQGGTGYEWHAEPLDNEHLKLLGHETQSASPKGILGGRIIEKWSFQALAPGDAKLGLLYFRSWEGSGKKLKEFKVRLLIK